MTCYTFIAFAISRSAAHLERHHREHGADHAHRHAPSDGREENDNLPEFPRLAPRANASPQTCGEG
jgi:hypothetical protein